MKTYVISDIHLFSKNCRPKATLAFLKEIRHKAKKLIILGDLFDSIDFDKPKKKKKKKHIKVLAEIRNLCDNGVEIIWIEGNHDVEAIEFFGSLIGSETILAKDHYEVNVGGNKWIFLHGHQFDTFITERPITTYIASKTYDFIQSIDGPHYSISRWIKRKSKTLLHICKANKEKALSYAKKHNGNFIVCGHTHRVGLVSEDDAIYINTGCWVDHPSHYLEIDQDGKYFIKEFHVIEKEGEECEEPLSTELLEKDLDIQ